MQGWNLTPRPFRAAIVLVLVLVSSLLFFPGGTDASSGWTIVSSPNIGTDLNDLMAVAAVSSSNIWAVGFYRNSSSQYQTLIELSNGSRWKVVSSPNVGTSYNFLNGVAALTAQDAWAVGQYYNGTTDRTLVEHWNGSSWKVVPSPNVGSGSNDLVAVTAIASNDVWAVGYERNSSFVFQPLAEHWDGTTWTVVAPPSNPIVETFLLGVAAVSSTDVWAVGRTDDPDSTLTMHWNGANWTQVSSPNGVGESLLSGVTTIATDDVWAVGAAGSVTLAEHWDGTKWTITPTPNPVPTYNGNNALNAVVANSSNDVWAVGTSINFTAGSLQQTITTHWDGTSWALVSSPNAGKWSNSLLGVTSASGTIWAVGHFNPNIGRTDHTLTMRNP